MARHASQKQMYNPDNVNQTLYMQSVRTPGGQTVEEFVLGSMHDVMEYTKESHSRILEGRYIH